jgi:hypothetical protein
MSRPKTPRDIFATPYTVEDETFILHPNFCKGKTVEGAVYVTITDTLGRRWEGSRVVRIKLKLEGEGK